MRGLNSLFHGLRNKMDKKELALQAVEVAKNSGKIRKGTNEVTKALEKGIAKLVVYAKDVQPAEIIMHLPILAKEKNVPCIEVDSKEELGAAAGIGMPTASVAIVNEGEAKKLIAQLKAE
ncbi:TPA: 50S ribosomal protein L7ae [Candidatus Woesearchaeota archaeon]|nr:ribosomal L7Ae/L30e/S12e/Gadd45 family protein [Candidatus Woesearchaeota archaeon]HIH39719.1 50S ribosomal protein L7ae [Candidatus Woesearchaeota archaeon]